MATSLTQKLQIKPGKSWLFFNAPPNYLAYVGPLPDGVTTLFIPNGIVDGIQAFIVNSNELAPALKELVPLLGPDTIFWITYPKKSSGMASDLEMMGSWDGPAKYGLRVVTSISVNETWTALRFKPKEATKISVTRNDQINQTEYAEYIDTANRQINLPPDVKAALENHPPALSFYQQLSFSNKKEYILWVITAKQEKTRQERLAKLVEKLSAGKKNPAEK